MNFISDYLNWHYLIIWPNLLVLWRNLAIFPFYYFSIPLHLSTLFSPWKRQFIAKKPGFHLDDVFGVISFNIISRIIGVLLRLSSIFTGLILMPIFCLFGAAAAVTWLFIPFLTVTFYLNREIPSPQLARNIFNKYRNDSNKLISRLLNQPIGQFICLRLNLPPDLIRKTLAENHSPAGSSELDAFLSRQKKEFGMPFLLYAAFNFIPSLKNMLVQNNLDPDDILKTASWFEMFSVKSNQKALVWDLQKIKSLSGIGVDWAYGYTPEFNKYARDITFQPNPYPFLVGREAEILAMEKILLKTSENNVLLVGEPGVARHLLVSTLAYRMRTGQCLPKLSHKRILNLDMQALTMSASTILEVKGLISQLLEEAIFAGNIIVYIDEIDIYLSDGPGRINLTEIFEKLATSSVGFIGVTTGGAYHKFIETNPTLNKLFERLEISDPARDTVLEELELSIVPVLENKYGVTISYPALKTVVDDADRYITNIPFPAKAIDLLDKSALTMSSETGDKLLLPIHIDKTLTEKMHIPVGSLSQKEKDKLANLENLLHQRVINQDEAVKSIASSLRRSRLNISSPNRPIGSFLFLGPTGVGKTETAKVLCDIYFGSTKNIIRLDMSQFQGFDGLEKLIGSVSLGNIGELTSKLADNPFTVLLLDEFEKGTAQIFNLFLTLLDEGYINDGMGKRIDAKNTIIIATSNAGAEFIREQIKLGRSAPDVEKDLVDYIMKQGIFSPELINRFDKVVVFTPLSEGHLREVARLMLQDLNSRLKKQELSVAVTPQLIEYLAYAGFDRQFGGRAMRRVISEKIEDFVARKLLSGEVKKGETITLSELTGHD